MARAVPVACLRPHDTCACLPCATTCAPTRPTPLLSRTLPAPQCLCRLEYAGPAEQPLWEAYPQGRHSEGQWTPQPDGSILVQHLVQPLRQEVCGHCGAVGGVRRHGAAAASGTVALRRCSACKEAAYCSPECQRAAWPEHRSACKAAAQAARQTAR